MTTETTENACFERLAKVASKQEEWKTLAISQKLALIDEILACLQNIGLEAWTENARGVLPLFKVPPATPLGDFIVSHETMLNVTIIISSLAALQDAYKIRLGQDDPILTQLKMDTAINGQVTARVFPLKPMDMNGPFGDSVGEVWFEPNMEMDKIRPFDFDKLEDPRQGALLVLGAGNYDLLTVIDALQGLFVMNQVVYVKLHPYRNHLGKLMRQIFAPLIREGFFDVEEDVSIERSAALVYSEWVGAVHMTGGKAAHDAIVWGADPNERKDRISRQDPKLKVRMTSELGCVTPWIVTAGEEYTPEELTHQAKLIASGIHSRGSANCNCPNTVVLAKSWTQRDAFVEAILQCWKDSEAPVVYYPGAKDRWLALQKAYPDSRVIESKPSENEETEAVLKKISLPLLVVDIDVDITTPEGIEKAKNEYAFSHEAFTPVLVIVVLDDTKEGAKPFVRLAPEFCNGFLFGTLSCVITVPPSMEGTDEVEQAIADLRYGTVAVNSYPLTYCIPNLAWGAALGERLDDIQSGIGKVQNRMFLPYLEKCVFRTPIISMGHVGAKSQSIQDATAENVGICQFVLGPSGAVVG